MDDAVRSRAIELVRRLLSGEFEVETEDDTMMDELARLLPDPNFSDLIYWPAHHQLSAPVAEADLTPERIVDLALAYRPFAL